MGKINSIKKGKNGELEVSHLLNSFGFSARRGQQYSGGGDSPDVVSDLGFHIEVKRVEAFNLYKAVDQAKNDCKSTDYTIFHRKSNREWIVAMDAHTFLAMMKHYKELKSKEVIVDSFSIDELLT